jgi:hypothetical protein
LKGTDPTPAREHVRNVPNVAGKGFIKAHVRPRMKGDPKTFQRQIPSCTARTRSQRALASSIAMLNTRTKMALCARGIAISHHSVSSRNQCWADPLRWPSPRPQSSSDPSPTQQKPLMSSYTDAYPGMSVQDHAWPRIANPQDTSLVPTP